MTAAPRIAVVGGGLAGLTCARRLDEHGCDVTVFDKGRQPGGRMATRAIGDDAFDHGAQYFTARSALFRQQVETWAAAGVVSRGDARVVTLAAGACTAAPDAQRFVGVPGMNAVATHVAAGLRVRAASRVQALARQADGWKVTLADGTDEGPYDRVVLAMPPEQTLALTPERSPLAAALHDVVLAPCQAVMVAFDDLPAADFDAAFVHAWVLHATPEWSRDHLDTEPARIAAMLLARFANLLGHAHVRPRLLVAHRWRWALPTRPVPEHCLYDAATGLAACGDWCGGARIESAFKSGRALADRLLGRAT